MCAGFFYSLFLLFFTTVNTTVSIEQTSINPTTNTLSIHFDVPQGDFLYKEYLNFSVDNPNVTLSKWQADKESVERYSPTFKETKQVFDQSVALTLHVEKTDDKTIDNAHVHMSYYQACDKKINEKIIPITFNTNTVSFDDKAINTTADTTTQVTKKNSSRSHVTTSWSEQLSDLIKTSDSLWLRMLFVLLLGLLLSLTPCVYPMIPITVGILQQQGSSSVFRNFLLALSYTIGIATTFSILGVIAAFTGQLFGSLLTNPIFIIGMVILLAYLALCMIGVYEMYTPKFLQNNTQAKGGSFISAFLFGAVSGTVASPCLSPGLILLLSIVTTIGSKLVGFALLFSFGIGLGIPLLIIGTFSGSMSVLPQAGMWMVEVKKIFGFMLFGMCFYFLKNIVPLSVLLWMISVFNIGAGVYYFKNIAPTDSPLWKTLKKLFGLVFIASSVLVATKAYQATFLADDADKIWIQNYDKALVVAQKEHKKLFVDIGAPYCTMCSAIDKKLLHNKKVLQHLTKAIPVKINGSDNSEVTKKVMQKYNVVGVPRILVINAETEEVLKDWGSELYDVDENDFVQELETVLG